MTLTIILLILAATLVWTWLLWREEHKRTEAIVVSPFLGWTFLYLVVVVYAALIQTSWDEIAEEPWALMIAVGGYVAFLTGFTLFRRPGELSRYFSKPKQLGPGESQATYYRAAKIFLVFLLLIGLATYWGVPPIVESWRSILRGEIREAIALSAAERFRLTKSPWFGGTDGGVMIFRSISQMGWPFLVIIGLVWIKENPRRTVWRRRWLRLTTASVILGVVIVGGDFTRLPVVAAVAMVTIGLTLHRPARPRSISVVVVIALALLVVLTASSSKGAGVGLQEIAARVQDRVSGNGTSDFEAIGFIREGVLDHRNGQEHFNRLVSSLPGVRVGTPFAYELAQLKGKSPNDTTYTSTTYLGIVYLDFGDLGVVIAYLTTGMLLALSYRWLYRHPRSPSHIAATALASWIIANWSQGGAILSTDDFVVMIAVWLTFRAGLRFVAPRTRPASHGGTSARRDRPAPISSR